MPQDSQEAVCHISTCVKIFTATRQAAGQSDSASAGAGGYPHHDDDDLRGVAEQASKHAGDSGDSDLFAAIVRAVGNKRHSLASEDIDEDGTRSSAPLLSPESDVMRPL